MISKSDNRPAFTTVGERELGGRKYIVRSDERLIGEHDDGWELSELAAWSSGDWVSLRLLDTSEVRREGKGRMRVYQLGFNRQKGRMAVNKFWHSLISHHADVAQWVILVMTKDKG